MIRVELFCSPQARQTLSLELSLPDGATLHHALQAAAADPRAAFLAAGAWDGGIWGRRHAPSTVLKDGDRVEVYRPLRCDPKEARRLRYRQSPAASRPAKSQA
jgi:putative ubiquitin-RnfH superfamily antitoxin RatB of RatAB toxin-antitoxin module